MVPSQLGRQIDEAVTLLRKGGVIAYPTDTLYGLGANPFCRTAVGRIFEIKGRSAQKALPLLIGGMEEMEKLVAVKSDSAEVLARAFWPGPLTLVLAKGSIVPDQISGGESVALRMPDHPIPLALVQSLGSPIVGTSANISGGPDSVTAEDVRRSLGDLVDYILDGGPCQTGTASTVVDVTGSCPKIVRHGAISREDIGMALGHPVESS